MLAMIGQDEDRSPIARERFRHAHRRIFSIGMIDMLVILPLADGSFIIGGEGLDTGIASKIIGDIAQRKRTAVGSASLWY